MFKEFLGFVKVENGTKIESVNDFMREYGGQSFLNGMYRVFSMDSMSKWNNIVEESFKNYKGRINVFGYDWLGRIFAVNTINDIVLLFEPGTGEVLNIGVNLIDFHNKEIVECHDACLASEFFEEWFEIADNFMLPNDKCVGYKVPLFLNGDDDVPNLEVSDMEVYWGIMAPLMNI